MQRLPVIIQEEFARAALDKNPELREPGFVVSKVGNERLNPPEVLHRDAAHAVNHHARAKPIDTSVPLSPHGIPSTRPIGVIMIVLVEAFVAIHALRHESVG